MKAFELSFRSNMRDISKHYKKLIETTKKGKFIGIVNEWIVDNYPILLEHANGIKFFLKSRRTRQLLKKKGERIYTLLYEICNRHQFKVDKEIILRSVSKYQEKLTSPLTYDELHMLKPLLLLTVFQEISKICANERNDLSDLIVRHYGKQNVKNIVSAEMEKNIAEHILVQNIFNFLKTIGFWEEEEIIEELSVTEMVLCDDPHFEKMDKASKGEYRSLILKKSKKQKKSELVLAKELIDESHAEKKHIGFFLKKPKKTKVRIWAYVSFITVATAGLSTFLSFYLSPWFYLTLPFLLIPVSELLIQLSQRFLMKRCRPKALYKMDYSKGLTEDVSTIVVIPTIIKNTKRIDEMFASLEKYYLTNQSNHLHFGLVGDACERPEAHWEEDEKLGKHGLKKCAELNEKYGKEIFHYIYRKRAYAPTEKSFLGWERKRGALIHLNKLLRKTLTDEQITNYFQAENLSQCPVKFKYVITLDSDTELVIGSVFGMVGAMAHPLNQPVIDEKKRKVVEGFAIMAPKVTLDIESSQKSPYVKLFGGGLGGFDVYNPVQASFYQDVFGEGSFVGKGIYNLDVYDDLVGDRFPEGLILSHDLMESNYLRSAFLSDVELMDGFPERFLSDMSRQSRWARGDTQILGWLGRKVKNGQGTKEKNPTTLLGRWKVFDNLRRMFFEPSLLALLVITLVTAGSWHLFWLAGIVGVLALPMIFYVSGQLTFWKMRLASTKPYRAIFTELQAITIRAYVSFVTLPYRAWLFFTSLCKALWRMMRKRRLLNWITAEEADKQIKNTQWNYLRNFKANYVFVAGLLNLVGFLNLTNIYIAAGISLLFLSAPFITFRLSQPSRVEAEFLSARNKYELTAIASKTWRFFEENLNEKNHFLIPDNWQLNRECKADTKTSPTNIGFAMTSVISAYRMKFIKPEKCLFLLSKIIHSVDGLRKWNGHLYNWYSLETFAPMYPEFVSSVDSGNFIAALITVKEFLREENQEHLVQICEKIIINADFSLFYSKNDTFSIGYNGLEGNFSIYNYQKFASESRLLSYLAIAKRDVPVKHWFCLDKTLTKHKRRKGLSSWSGSLFEYYMPYIFLKSYPNTLFDEAYDFAYDCQKQYMKEVDEHLPWGISECAFDELDAGVNYLYKTFGVPTLKMQENVHPHIVLSPYSSALLLPRRPKTVLANLRRFIRLGMYGKYGFYESYDTKTSSPILSYFAHHQGMILASICNYIDNFSLQKYFEKDASMAAFDVLNKEKMQIRPAIDMEIQRYKKHTYQKERPENSIRRFTFCSEVPETAMLSNGKYSVVLTDKGTGYSKYHDIQLNRSRKVTRQEFGSFLFIRDAKTGSVWSNTYAPTFVEPEAYEVVFASDKIRYMRSDDGMVTTTEIVVAGKHQAEIRRVTFRNLSGRRRELELTTYVEPTVTQNANDVTHRTFQSLFLTPEYDFGSDALIYKRNLRNSSTNYYFLHKMFSREFEDGKCEFETKKSKFIGNRKSLAKPEILMGEMSCSTDLPIDPIASVRNRLILEDGEAITIFILQAFGTSKEQVLEAAEAYDTALKVEKAFEEAAVSNHYMTKLLNLTAEEIDRFDTMLNFLSQTSKISVTEERREVLKRNYHTHEDVWKFGISGSHALICVTIHDMSSFSLVQELLKAFSYFKSRASMFDLVIINEEKDDYKKYIEDQIKTELYRIGLKVDLGVTTGKVFVLDGNQMTDNEKILLNMVSRLRFDSSKDKSLADCVKTWKTENMPVKHVHAPYQRNLLPSKPQELEFFSGYGGFTQDGSEYVVTDVCTPAPWCNILSNKEFGTVITANGQGFTYAYNSQEFKISAWTNDISSLCESEGILVNGKRFSPSKTTHGFGYSVMEAETDEFVQKVSQYVPREDKVKIFIVEIKNKSAQPKEVRLSQWINPVLGTTEERTSRYILAEFNAFANALEMRNVYHAGYSDVKVTMSSSEKIEDYAIDSVVIKQINTTVILDANETREVVFMLGAEREIAVSNAVLKKYSDVRQAKEELSAVKEQWKEKLSVITAGTPDRSFNIFLPWLLYQTITSRIQARTGFYQVSGAFGYRDQLQDSVNLVSVYPDITRKQIIRNAKHQFVEGDVLHWWLEHKMFGLRSRYSDDALWLVYAVCEYLEKTGDVSILDEEIPFLLGEKLNAWEEEKGMIYRYTSFTKPLIEHLTIIIEHIIANLGEHGIPKMAGGDWNDGMNKIGIHGRGESVWLGFFFYQNLGRFETLLSSLRRLDPEVSAKWKLACQQLRLNLLTHCWDGNYYLRAFHDSGNKIGSAENLECKIDLLSQSFSILSEVALPQQIPAILQSVEEKLLDRTHGMVKLLTPAFHKSSDYPGYIQDYPKGIRENGGQYTHSVAWYMEALHKVGKTDEAFGIFQMINPINRTPNAEEVKKYAVEPYILAADIYSNQGNEGRGGWTWYTGSSGWFYRQAVELFMGMRKIGDTLVVTPNKLWKNYSFAYRHNGVIYDISVKSGKEDKIVINGKAVNEIILTAEKDVKIKIEWNSQK